MQESHKPPFRSTARSTRREPAPATRVERFTRVTASTLGVGLALLLSACSSSGGSAGGVGGSGGVRPSASSTTVTATSTTVHNVPIDPKTAEFGQAFRLGKLTIVVTDAGSVPDSNPGASARRRLIVATSNSSSAPDRAPGLAIVCEQRPEIAGGSLYTDPRPAPRPFVAGKLEPAGAKDIASTTLAVNPTCPRPALQVSTGGATINGLPGPVLISMG